MAARSIATLVVLLAYIYFLVDHLMTMVVVFYQMDLVPYLVLLE
jgi:hypothetical protein